MPVFAISPGSFGKSDVHGDLFPGLACTHLYQNRKKNQARTATVKAELEVLNADAVFHSYFTGLNRFP